MTNFRNIAVAALFAAPLALSPALAQDEMMQDEEMMHDMQVTCSVVAMDEMGLTIEFHNMGDADIPAGTMGHWMVPGVAQGDVNFMDAVGPDGMKEQMYRSDTMVHGSADAPCEVEMM